MLRLARTAYQGHTVRVARNLLGKLVVRCTEDGRLAAGRIVETEAYHGWSDRASHAHRGQTPRTAPMFGPAGVAYVYQVYGVWFCFNAVTGNAGFPAAVLVRALAPVEALPFTGDDEPRRAAGPGKLCRALDIDRRHTGEDLVTSPVLWLADDGARVSPRRISAGPRIGVDYAGDWAKRPWRFWIADDPHVSTARSARKAPR